jgi:hypothetical protein
MVQKTKVLTTCATLLVLNGFIGVAHGQVAPSNTIEFPMVGIGFGQTFQLDVITFNPCGLQLAILDSNGVTAATSSAPPSDTFSIKFNSIKINYTKQVPNFPQRKQFHATVGAQPTTAGPCQAQATVEVFDDLTRADWVLTPGLIPPGPQQIPPGPPNIPIFLGPVALTFEQTARLNVVAHPPSPCIGTLSFTDTSGNPVGSPTPVNLGANQATFVDLPGFQAGTALNTSRPEVIGVFTPSASTTTPPSVCIPSVEVFDRITGYTRVLIPPGPQTLPVGIPPGPTQ